MRLNDTSIDDTSLYHTSIISTGDSQALLQPQKINFTQALDKVGANGWYQMRAFIIFSMQWLLGAFILLSFTFLFQPPIFDCSDIPGQEHLADVECQKYVCDLPRVQQKLHLYFGTWKHDTHNPVTREFDLYCENDYKNTIIESMTALGSLVGFTIFPAISDNKGPRLALISSWSTCFFGCVLMAISNDYFFVVMGYFFAGFGVNPAITLSFTFINDHSTGKFREFTCIGTQVMYGIGELLFILIAYQIDSWRNIVIYFWVIPVFIIGVMTVWLVYESPQYVYKTNTIRAIGVLNKIAQVNKKDVLPVNTLQSVLKLKNVQTRNLSFIDLFRYKSLRLTSYAACFIFFTIQTIYYGISYNMSSVGLNLYLNIAIIASAETLAYSITDLLVPYLKRKQVTLFGFLIGAVLTLSFMFLKVPDDCKDICSVKIIQIVLLAVLRFSICFVWTVTYIYDSELFPASVRSLALGLVSLCGTVGIKFYIILLGSFLSPYVILFCQQYGMSPMIIYGILSLIGAFHVIFLQETKGKPLIEQIKELEGIKEDIAIDVVNDKSQIDSRHA